MGVDGMSEGQTPPPMTPRGEAGKAVGPVTREAGPQIGVSGKPSGAEAPTPGQAFVDDVVRKGGAQELPNTNPPEMTVPVANVEPLMEAIAREQAGEVVQAPVEGAPDIQPASQAEAPGEPAAAGSETSPSLPADDSERQEDADVVPAQFPQTDQANQGVAGEMVTAGADDSARADGPAPSAQPAQEPTNQPATAAVDGGRTASQPDNMNTTDLAANTTATLDQAPQPAQPDNATKSPEPPVPPQTPDAGPGVAGKTPDQRGGMAPSPDSPAHEGDPNPPRDQDPTSGQESTAADASAQKSPEQIAAEAALQGIEQRIVASRQADRDALIGKIQKSISEGANNVAALQREDLSRMADTLHYQAILSFARENRQEADIYAKANGFSDVDALLADADLRLRIIGKQEGLLNQEAGGFFGKKPRREALEEWARSADRLAQFPKDAESRDQMGVALQELNQLRGEIDREVIQQLLAEGVDAAQLMKILPLVDDEGKTINKADVYKQRGSMEQDKNHQESPEQKNKKKKAKHAHPTWAGAVAQVKADKEAIAAAKKEIGEINKGQGRYIGLDDAAKGKEIEKQNNIIASAQAEKRRMHKYMVQIAAKRGFLAWVAAEFLIVVGGFMLTSSLAAKLLAPSR